MLFAPTVAVAFVGVRDGQSLLYVSAPAWLADTFNVAVVVPLALTMGSETNDSVLCVLCASVNGAMRTDRARSADSTAPNTLCVVAVILYALTVP